MIPGHRRKLAQARPLYQDSQVRFQLAAILFIVYCNIARRGRSAFLSGHNRALTGNPKDRSTSHW